ncbi:hypothetical protein ACJMK2_008317 [Sinanodonta woodiana]|uniref:SUZ RNA-binding domain-containing n=1 Tax=Sinanodonta woodiana TaxID=1069815 RepID=A0ABD3VP97_SINWO
MAEDGGVLDSWEELENNDVLDKKLESLKISTPQIQTVGSDGGQTILQEEGCRTQYQPQVRILKREDNSKPQHTIRGKANSKPVKSLEQREAEYAEARKRILGEDYVADPTPVNDSNTSAFSSEDRPIRLVQQVEELKKTNTNSAIQIVREPKGPDGSKGFCQNR